MARKGLILPKYDFRHVRAHNGLLDSRSKANNWCDQEAKKWMREAVKLKIANGKI